MAVRMSSPSGQTGVALNAEMNVTPFVDVMLVLLIIFMVVAATATSAVKVDLPIAAPSDEIPKTPVTVSLTADGGIYVNDQLATLDGLAGTVMTLLTDGAHEDRVVVRADKTISYEHFMDAMSTLNTGGVGKLALVSEAKS